MATDLGRTKSTAASKYDVIVASQLKQAETRIRVLDLIAGLFGFASLSLAYIVGMVLCDSQFLFSQQTRQLALYLFLAGAIIYLFFAVLRPLRLPVNRYYAARQIEQQLPQAKNSIVNWVDLHEQPLPPAIRTALGQRAARDLSRIDMERAIRSRRTSWMGGLAGLFAMAFIGLYFLLGPAPFVSLLKRTFNPFEAVGVSTRTRLTLLKPEGGDATITVGRGVNFVVDVGGKVPDPKAADAVKLLYRYEEGDPWLERRLVLEPSGEWTTSLSALEVKNGFWYQITGGDAATEEHRIRVRAAPAILDFLATYHFRPYVARPDEVRRERELKALRGTEVRLRVHTNRTLREGRLEFAANGRERVVNLPFISVPGEVDELGPHTFLVHFVLKEDGKYRLSFTSTDGEVYSDLVSFPVTALPDQPPTVELTKPGEDVRLPTDGLLQLEGKAADDIGVRSLVLRMRVIGGDKLREKPYRSDEQLHLADGGHPRQLEYKDFVDLSCVQDEDGRNVLLRAGMELEYWLEASDACDYPQPNVAESKHYRVLLTDPEKNDPKKDQEKKRAETEKKQHEQKQDQKLQKENQERRQQRQEQQARNHEEENKSKGADKGGAGGQGQPQEDQPANKPESKENRGRQGAGKGAQGEPNSGEQKGELSKEDQKVEDQIKKALQRKQAAQGGTSEAKHDKGNTGEGRSEQSNKPGGKDGLDEGDTKKSGQRNAQQTSEGKGKDQPQAGGNPSPSGGNSDKSEKKNSNSKDEAGPEARQKAGQALKKLGESDGPTAKGSLQKDSGPSTELRGRDKEKTKSGGPKDNGASREKSAGKDASSNLEKGQANKGGKDRSSSGAPDGLQNASGGNTPGGGVRRSGGGPSDTHDAASPAKQDKPHDHRAALLQLEDLAKRVDKDVLKDAGVSEEAWKKYLEAKRKLLTPREKPRPEVPSAPQQAIQLPSMGGRAIQPSASGQSDALSSDRGQPPPGYRDSFREFTRQMSKDK
jgi:collagen type III alpha